MISHAGARKKLLCCMSRETKKSTTRTQITITVYYLELNKIIRDVDLHRLLITIRCEFIRMCHMFYCRLIFYLFLSADCIVQCTVSCTPQSVDDFYSAFNSRLEISPGVSKIH